MPRRRGRRTPTRRWRQRISRRRRGPGRPGRRAPRTGPRQQRRCRWRRLPAGCSTGHRAPRLSRHNCAARRTAHTRWPGTRPRRGGRRSTYICTSSGSRTSCTPRGRPTPIRGVCAPSRLLVLKLGDPVTAHLISRESVGCWKPPAASIIGRIGFPAEKGRCCATVCHRPGRAYRGSTNRSPLLLRPYWHRSRGFAARDPH
mmetsp:Transcript_17764/g.44752  ORF Transcript_17764/g.44752 Transcript_17764/m.44752 type:complete len:201 (-) Transcript_17764:67-669(-)